jgi:hypothetical protein
MGRRYGLSPGDLARINRFSYNTELHEGQRIVVYSPTGEPPREISMGLTPEPRRPKGGAAPATTGAKPATKIATKPDAAKPDAAKAGAKAGAAKLETKPGSTAKPGVAKPAPGAAAARPATRSVAVKAPPAPPKK